MPRSRISCTIGKMSHDQTISGARTFLVKDRLKIFFQQQCADGVGLGVGTDIARR